MNRYTVFQNGFMGKQRSSIVLDLARLMLLVIMLFNEALKMIALSPKDSMTVSHNRCQARESRERVCKYILRPFCTVELYECMPQ